MPNYNRTIGFNAGLAEEIGITAAIVFDELSFFSGKGAREDGWIWKSYEEMLTRLPFLTEFMLRKAYKRLIEVGYIQTKIMKVSGNPTFHYQVLKNFSPVTEKIKETIETEKTSETIYTSTNTSTNTQQDELLNMLNTITGRSFRTLPRGVGKLLKTFSLGEIGTALDNMKQDPWHKERLASLSSDYLLRATIIDKFLTSTPNKEKKYL